MQENHMNSPEQVLKANIKIEENRVNMSRKKLLLLGILAGMFIGLGAAASSVAMHSIGNVGLARVVGGTIFPVGLMMIVFIGGELFTGDCLLILGILCNIFVCGAVLMAGAAKDVIGKYGGWYGSCRSCFIPCT